MEHTTDGQLISYLRQEHEETFVITLAGDEGIIVQIDDQERTYPHHKR